jgi:hypothetical protein
MRLSGMTGLGSISFDIDDYDSTSSDSDDEFRPSSEDEPIMNDVNICEPKPNKYYQLLLHIPKTEIEWMNIELSRQ